MADADPIPDGGPELAPLARGQGRGRRQAVRQHLGRAAARPPKPHESGGHGLRPPAVQQVGGHPGLVPRTGGQRLMLQQTQILARLHLFGRRRLAPVGHQLRALQQPLRLAHLGRRHDQDRGPLAPRPPGPAGTVQQHFGIGRQVGMDHQFQPRQVDPPRGHIGRDADPRPPVAQRLQGVHPFGLRQFARQRHHLKTAVHHPGEEVIHVRPGLGKNDRRRRLVEAQHVEDRVFLVARLHRQRLIGNVGVLLRFALHHHPLGILLEGAGQLLDLLRHGGREHQRPPGFRRRAQDEFKILGKAQIQHLVRLVQHHGAGLGQIQ